MAQEYGLRLLPAVPSGQSARAEVDVDIVSPEELCDLARASGARVLFHSQPAFDAQVFPSEVVDDDIEDDDEGDRGSDGTRPQLLSPAMEELCRSARRRDGLLAAVELAVVVDASRSSGRTLRPG
jgi:hypothetical protein